MAGRGRGRGGQSLSFNLPSFGSGESMPSVTLQPPPLYPMLQHRVTPLSSLEVDEYMLALSQEFRGSIRDSPFYLKEKICKKDIVRYTDRYKQTQNIDANMQWEPDWRLFPNELKPERRKRNVKEPQIKSTIAKKIVSNPNNDVSTDEIVLKLELKEEIEKEEGKEKGEEKENENEEGQDEEEEIDVSEDDNDYNFDYYDDGGDKYGDDNDGEEGPVY